MSETTNTEVIIPNKSKIRHVDILNNIRQSHLLNGLRTDDYTRYRRYCSRHISRTRRAIKGAIQPHKKSSGPNNAPKVIRSAANPTAGVSQDAIIPTTAELLRDTRYAEIQLALAERAWAYWMELRGDGTAGKTSDAGVADEHTRVYYHLINRLKKAVGWAEVLECRCLTGYVSKKINFKSYNEEDDDDDDDENEKISGQEKTGDDVIDDAMDESQAKIVKKSKADKIKAKAAELNKKHKGYNLTLYLKDHFNESNIRWCDERTALEACVYASWMRGNLALETERWSDAIREFGISTLLCKTLLRTEFLPERKAVLQERIDEMEPQLRFAAYNARTSLNLSDSPADLCPELADLVESVISASEEANSALFAKIRWGGRYVPVRNAAVRRALEGMHKAAKSGEDLTEAHKKASTALHAELDALTKKIAAKERFPAAVRALEQQKGDIVMLVEYLHWLKAEKTSERSVVRAREMQFKLSEGALSFKLNSEVKQSKESDLIKKKESNTKCVCVNVNEIVKLYDVAVLSAAEADILIKRSEEMASKVKVDDNSDDAAVVDDDDDDDSTTTERKMLKNAHGMAVRAERCYFVGLSYLRKKAWAEANALFERAQKMAGDAAAHLAQCKGAQQDDLAVMKAVEAQARAMRCVAVARSNMKVEEAEDKAGKKKEEEEEEEEEEEVTVEEPLYGSNLDEWPSTLKQNRPIASLELPQPEVLQCRPILLDVAFDSVEYPDLTARKKVSKGFFGLW